MTSAAVRTPVHEHRHRHRHRMLGTACSRAARIGLALADPRITSGRPPEEIPAPGRRERRVIFRRHCHRRVSPRLISPSISRLSSCPQYAARNVLRTLVRPESEHQPPSLCKRPVCLKVPLDVPLDFRNPIVSVPFRLFVVFRTPMPKTSVDQYCNFLLCECDVDGSAQTRHRLEVHPVPQAPSMENSAHFQLGQGVASPVALHRTADRVVTSPAQAILVFCMAAIACKPALEGEAFQNLHPDAEARTNIVELLDFVRESATRITDASQENLQSIQKGEGRLRWHTRLTCAIQYPRTSARWAP
jgi:hypothetical protein